MATNVKKAKKAIKQLQEHNKRGIVYSPPGHSMVQAYEREEFYRVSQSLREQANIYALLAVLELLEEVDDYEDDDFEIDPRQG